MNTIYDEYKSDKNMNKTVNLASSHLESTKLKNKPSDPVILYNKILFYEKEVQKNSIYLQ